MRTIGGAVREWRQLCKATRLRPDGGIDTAAIYAYYSGRSPEEVERAVVVIQRRWRRWWADARSSK